MTEVTAYADSGLIQDTDYLWLARAGVGYKVVGTRLVRTDATGNVGLGTAVTVKSGSSPSLNIAGALGVKSSLDTHQTSTVVLETYLNIGRLRSYGTAAGTGALAFNIGGGGNSTDVEAARIDPAGNLLVGATTGTNHRIVRSVAEGGGVLSVEGTAGTSVLFFSVGGLTSGAAQQGAAIFVGKHTGTNRSINTSGTINASGTDYAEYMRKAEGCGLIAKGDVVGVDRDGHLTRRWSDAIAFVVKSTEPSYVGGDAWGAEVGERPAAPPEPSAPEKVDRAYRKARREWEAVRADYPAVLAEWEKRHEAARATVDRIAFSGQVPVNYAGDAAPGDYLVAVASGAGIALKRVAVDDMTLPDYMRRVGRVWAVRDGRPWIDVQHG